MNGTSDALRARMVRPRIGLLPTGHFYYWDQFPELREMGLRMYRRLRGHLEAIGDVVAPDLVDTREKAVAAAEFFRRAEIDILLVFPFGYTPAMCVVPVARAVDVPIRLLNAHEDRSYDFAAADTTVYLHHEGVCCIPEYANALRAIGKSFRVRTGWFGDDRLWKEIGDDCRGAAAARAWRKLRFGVIGETYTNMTDMPIDETRLLRATGNLLVRPEVEEIEEAYTRVTEAELGAMYGQLRAMYDMDADVADEDLRESAGLAAAYEQVAKRNEIAAFGFYWWGEKERITALRAQAALAVSRLTSLGVPGVTEGDVKTAMAMKALDLLGAGGMFVEFFAMDFAEEIMLLGHDGPSNVNLADGRPRLRHLDVHHGKSGRGLGIDFAMQGGPVTLVNLTHALPDAHGANGGDSFTLIYTVAEVVPGPILGIGNPNCRVRLSRPMSEFMDAWCQEGPSHHIALGLGDHAGEIAAFAEALGFRAVRV